MPLLISLKENFIAEKTVDKTFSIIQSVDRKNYSVVCKHPVKFFFLFLNFAHCLYDHGISGKSIPIGNVSAFTIFSCVIILPILFSWPSMRRTHLRKYWVYSCVWNPTRSAPSIPSSKAFCHFLGSNLKFQTKEKECGEKIPNSLFFGQQIITLIAA